MTFILLGFLFIYLIDNKKLRIVLCCFLPAFIILPVFFKPENTEQTAFYAAMILVCAAPLIEKAAAAASCRLQYGIKHTIAPESAAGTAEQEEDVLDNKKKWHLIIAGYIIFILFAVFSCIAIFRLNSKINSMYEITQDLKDQIQTTQEK